VTCEWCGCDLEPGEYWFCGDCFPRPVPLLLPERRQRLTVTVKVAGEVL
jgi:hypothetical protein